MARIGLVGCGNIAGIVARHRPRVDFVAVFDRHPERADALARDLGAMPHHRFESFIDAEFDVVLEAASVQALHQHGEDVLRHDRDLIALSVGAFADRGFRGRMESLAAARGRTIRIPSGALFGLDNLKVGRVAPIGRLLLRTTKSPAALGVDVSGPTLLFRGGATECIAAYPKNVNVAVALSLAAGREAQVELWADPAATENRHEVVVEGRFGRADIAVSNLPSPDNPRTSYLAALSVIALLNDLDNPLVVGT